jgi:hypothetical protein
VLATISKLAALPSSGIALDTIALGSHSLNHVLLSSAILRDPLTLVLVTSLFLRLRSHLLPP